MQQHSVQCTVQWSEISAIMLSVLSPAKPCNHPSVQFDAVRLAITVHLGPDDVELVLQSTLLPLPFHIHMT